MLHPGDSSKGNRVLPFEGTVVLPASELVPGAAMVRLKDLFNVNIVRDGEKVSFSYGGDSLSDARATKAHIIQWLPAQQTVPCTLLTMEGEMKGVCEPAVTKEWEMSCSSSGSGLSGSILSPKPAFVRISRTHNLFF